VDFLYNIKVNSNRETPDYLIANTLYGRFGKNKHIIVNHKESLSYHKNKIITNVIDLQKDKN